ncbi:2',3'-cyclic-nucleotide 2'-phosphodiesterase/3'-nucleotidase [Peptoniphilus koenoeneniae]|uniref:2',3'-cyclic-nucleotide 2'-phosphodiesterase/3'-nucleotidase n=1 Tax=Peptoniphilus koenoeneniae TaxID=507751 RepID=A0ABU0AX59_9FIRM|nr:MULTISPECIES: 5'-nucleotidase C-terminal domain-containing protein [Peptoniphilus]ERT61508.1 5'-nucleotidase, C-terminal domain protein [Peptoniphilus sp. BV3C26]MDQ0275362.1 2',3'-cyclic-nucleotide 2'-phosphodiesterase/3'-nucleotidase [Peptoniphilus koenoeneniae]
MKKKISKILSAFIMLSMLLTFAFADSQKINLTIIGTSDIHANPYGYSYEDNKEGKNNGLARIATYVEEERKKGPIVLIDDGDTYQGTIMSDAIYNKKKDVIHPMSKVLDYMKYDATVLGNHEFNFGIDFLKKIVNEKKTPTLAANLTTKDGKNFEQVKPYVVVERQGIKIGILGLTNPNVPRWDGDKVKSLNFKGLTETAKKYVPILKEKEKCDLVIVAAHAGLVPEYDIDGGSDGLEKLIEEVKGVDLVLAGHFHMIDKGEKNGVVYGAPRNNGRDLVKFQLVLEKTPEGYKTIEKKVDVIKMDDVKPSESLRNVIKEEHENTINFIQGTGKSSEAGGGIFGIATADFQPKNEIRKIPQGWLEDSGVIDLIGKCQLKMSGADVTAVALFRDDSDLHKGNITYGDIFKIYKFDNTLYTVNVTGKELKDYMEWSAAFYNQYKKGDLSVSFSEDVPGYRYDIFKGVDYKIDLSQEAGNRIKDVMYKGKALKDDQVLKLAVNNYRYSSGLKANKLVAGNRDWESPIAIRDYIANYIKEQKKISPTISKNWEIIGTDFNNPLRKEIIELVNEGYIEAPYHESLNIEKLKEKGIIVDGKVVKPKEKVENDEITKSEKSSPNKGIKKEIKKEVQEQRESQKKTYTVKSGDWIYKISRELKLNAEEIINANSLKNPNLIFPGQILNLPK